MPTPMDEFPPAGRSGGILMTPHGPPPEVPVLSPEVPTTGEQIPIEYGGKMRAITIRVPLILFNEADSISITHRSRKWHFQC